MWRGVRSGPRVTGLPSTSTGQTNLANAAYRHSNLVSSRVSYSFSPRVYVQALVQYNDRANLWSSNVRFGWLNQANTGLFVVYNDTQGLVDSTLMRADRSLTIKFSRLVDLLN